MGFGGRVFQRNPCILGIWDENFSIGISVSDFSQRGLRRMVPLELHVADVTWALGHGHEEFMVSNLAFQNSRSKLA